MVIMKDAAPIILLLMNLYFTGDGALKDDDGNYRITGRVDDVLNVSGHRIGTAEVENAINMHAGCGGKCRGGLSA
jgi:acyl-coenzyme A synthetase/AMP-(fatty) acid ligase